MNIEDELLAAVEILSLVEKRPFEEMLNEIIRKGLLQKTRSQVSKHAEQTQEDILTISEIHKQYKVHPQTIYKKIRQKQIEVVSDHKPFKIKRSVIQRYLKNHKSGYVKEVAK